MKRKRKFRDEWEGRVPSGSESEPRPKGEGAGWKIGSGRRPGEVVSPWNVACRASGSKERQQSAPGGRWGGAARNADFTDFEWGTRK
ncbi:unnamed protein product [Nesidiocoris tenuis]|uniref:Uncharacterized protein n=1 Tax=Nesidiocoris tenuis TaxID=355587 RepID=A0A6H5GAB1_9HEMI|nr:unnamed protein product [Nesidiocoris tenuis]